jgi:trigger factor
MPDEPRPEGHPEPAPPQYHESAPPSGAYESKEGRPSDEEEITATATEEIPDVEDGEEEPPQRLNQEVNIQDVGPCKKHIKVVIPRDDIEGRLNQKFSEMMVDSNVPGYRPGKAPRKLVEKRFYKEVSEQLKAEMLLQSLEQLAEDHHLNPIAQPDLNPFKVELPKEGPLEYEFDIEVAPEFDLPAYKGLKLKRPVREVSDADVAKAQARFLKQYGTLTPKDGPAEVDDYLVAEVVVSAGGQELSRFNEITVRLDPQLAFKDGMVKDFGAKMNGVRVGESRQVDIVLSANVSNPELEGRVIQGTFNVKEVKYLRLPELTHDFLHRLGVHSADQLREKVRQVLQRQLEYEQRKAAREQVLDQIAAAASWELPRDLLRRQARKTLERKIMELRSAGFPEEEIRSRANLLRQDVVTSTARALKEHFVLQKIAEVENMEVTDEDVELEIEMIAAQSDESPRRVRARLDKEELMETLMTQLLERKALDLVLDSAEYEDVPFQQEAAVGAVEEQAVPGEQPEEPEAAPTEAAASSQ